MYVSLPFPDYAVNAPMCYDHTLILMDSELEEEKEEEEKEEHEDWKIVMAKCGVINYLRKNKCFYDSISPKRLDSKQHD